MSHGKDTVLLIDDADWSSIFQNSVISGPVDMADNTTYGSESKTYEPGADDGTMTLEAIYKASLRIGSFWGTKKTAKLLISRAIDGFVIGNSVQVINGWLQSHDVPAPVGDIVKTQSTIQADTTGIGYGKSLSDLVAVVAAGTGTVVDDAAASTDGAFGVLHVTAFSGTSVTVTIQDSADNITWVDLVTFTAATGITSQLVEVTGSVDRYVRAEWSGTFTTATFAVVLGRR